MPDIVTLGPWLRRFLGEHIVTERNLARNTQKSYRDTFSLLLPFVSRKLRKPVDRLAVGDLTSRQTLLFLAHLEEKRGCSIQTRNQRLAAIRAFARFVGSRDPAQVEWCGQIRAIPPKKAMPQPVGWLTKAEMDAMLKVPDRKTPRGQREYALLLFLYNTGARVSEAIQLKTSDLHVGHRDGHALATLHGKGGKTRQCPLWPETERVLADLIGTRAADDSVFLSRLRKPFTRFGVYRLVERYAARVPSLSRKTITPHVLRHTTACHLVLAGVDINTVRAWLGQCVDRHHQHLCRDRPDAEGQGRGPLRRRRSASAPTLEIGQGPDGLPEILVNQGFSCGVLRPALPLRAVDAAQRSPS